MTGLTHQLVALLAALWVLTAYPVMLGPFLAIAAIVAVMVGALTPDLDQPTADLWRRLLGARTVGNIFQTFSGGHRHFTHSVVGLVVVGYATYWGAHHLIHPQYVPAAHVIWTAFMIGYISHPIADTLTDLGVPWLWPLPLHFKIPPGPRALRVTTGSVVERIVVRSGIIISGLLLLRKHWSILLRMFQ